MIIPWIKRNTQTDQAITGRFPVACKHVFLRFPVYVCGFCGSEAAHCISLWDRVRSGEEGRLEGLEGAGDVGGMSLGGKL